MFCNLSGTGEAWAFGFMAEDQPGERLWDQPLKGRSCLNRSSLS